MAKRSPYDFATAIAEKLIKDELKISALPIDPIAIAKNKGIRVEAMPPDHDGVSGMLIHANGKFVIAYATYIKSKGFRRFSIGHEIGHYCLPGHIDAVLPNGAAYHESNSGFVSDNKYELEADHFAAGLLMPAPLFRTAMTRAGEGLDAIELLHDRCITSLTATAIRYQQLTDEAVAVIQSKGKTIDFCFLSDRMLTLQPRRWPRKGDLLPLTSATHKLNHDVAKVARSERIDGPADGAEWFGGFRDVELFEEAVGLGSYGRSLTILTTVDDLPEEDDVDQETRTDESWKPRF